MIRCRYDHYIARQLIKLQKQEGHNSLDLPRLVTITPLFANGIKLVKEQNTWTRANEVEKLAQPRVSLPQVASNQGVVSNDKERQP